MVSRLFTKTATESGRVTGLRKRLRSAGMLVLLLTLGAYATPTLAQQSPYPNLGQEASSNRLFDNGTSITLKQATAIAKRHTGGRVLSANARQRNSGKEFRVRMLVDGERVVTVTVDGNGQVRNRH